MVAANVLLTASSSDPSGPSLCQPPRGLTYLHKIEFYATQPSVDCLRYVGQGLEVCATAEGVKLFIRVRQAKTGSPRNGGTLLSQDERLPEDTNTIATRWTVDRSDEALPEIKCAGCGVTAGESTENWTHCEECDTHYCPKCSGTFREEKEDVETLSKGSAQDQLRVLCPRCGERMMNLS